MVLKLYDIGLYVKYIYTYCIMNVYIYFDFNYKTNFPNENILPAAATCKEEGLLCK